MELNSSTQQFLKEAVSFTPLLLNVSCNIETHNTYPKCMQVATAFCTYMCW